jgi:hypothetical protein
MATASLVKERSGKRTSVIDFAHVSNTPISCIRNSDGRRISDGIINNVDGQMLLNLFIWTFSTCMIGKWKKTSKSL